MTQPFTPTDSRQRNIRIVLFVVILATIPFYCIGILLWLAAPQNGSAPIIPPTVTELTAGAPSPTSTLEPGLTPTAPDATVIQTDIFVPTSVQPATLRPLTATPTLVFPSPTPIIPTVAIPTQTPIPPLQPTATTLPIFPSETPLGGAP